jgi:hypothetical protein
MNSLRFARHLVAAVVLACSVPAGAEAVLTGDNNDSEAREQPMPGTLVLPGEVKQKQDGKKCMTVCARWGEECVYINRGTGGTERKCRRTCQQFTSECF